MNDDVFNYISNRPSLAAFQLCVAVIGATLASLGALWYFRRVRLERPAIGRFNGRDIMILLMCLAMPIGTRTVHAQELHLVPSHYFAGTHQPFLDACLHVDQWRTVYARTTYLGSDDGLDAVDSRRDKPGFRGISILNGRGRSTIAPWLRVV